MMMTAISYETAVALLGTQFVERGGDVDAYAYIEVLVEYATIQPAQLSLFEDTLSRA